MSGSSGNTKESTRLQERSLALQEKTAADQQSFLERQLQALKQTKPAPYLASSPAPTMGSSGAGYAAQQEKLDQSRRFGIPRTVRAGMRYGGAVKQVA